MAEQPVTTRRDNPAWWQAVLFPAMAGGLGWGIRGQYGHETGAMIAGLLVSLTLALLLCPRASSLSVARAVAWATVAMGFGGTMTYGQTIGLTQNPGMIGNWEALSWGMLGLAIKGGIWIGFTGVFLGMGVGGVRYRPLEVLLLMLGLLGAYFLGALLLNSPFDPEHRRLPWIYFSATWYWEPNATALEPRPESWGGLLFALATAIVYSGVRRKDGLALRMALWGLLGGILGFPGGQCLQAFHAWNPELFRSGLWTWLDPNMNWWNWMETTFGAIMGGALGLGLWLNRARIRMLADSDVPVSSGAVGAILLSAHLALLIGSEIMDIPAISSFYDLGLIMGVIPLVAIAGGRFWPYLAILPITMLPIAYKTVFELVDEKAAISPVAGWTVYFVAPMLLVSAAAVWFRLKAAEGQDGRTFACDALLLCVWMYWFLNFAFFRYSWPWTTWTNRTPNGIIFAVFAVALTAMAWKLRRLPVPEPADHEN
ncbi:MAG: hypothetical protein IT364_03715 [Candidatus Hydrogenedentes bacterium]|nr:hypothetical protein [Candidatus Hydrogenedentota bacterium]